MGSPTNARVGAAARPLVAAALGIFHITSGQALAWSDEGHMLVAAVAKLVLPEDTVAKVESLLHKWDVDFPGVGRMETSSVWLDHVACREQVPHCGGFKSLDDVQLFRAWHYSNRVLNPQNVELEGVYKFYPLPQTGAEWALNTTYRSLTDTEGALALPAPDAQMPGSRISLVPFRRGSNFSLNLHLRLLLHIFGDLHQPLHACSLFARGFPKGDEGGNEISIEHPEHARTLHYLWDSGGLVFTKPFFRITWDEISRQAKAIMAEYPQEKLQARLSGRLSGDNFSAIAEESEKIALKEAYAEFDWKTFSRASLPYSPSPEYIDRVRNVAREQIAVAGYRLAYVLSLIAPHLPSPMSREHMSTYQSLQDALSGMESVEEWRNFRLSAARQHIPLDDDEYEELQASDPSAPPKAESASKEQVEGPMARNANIEGNGVPPGKTPVASVMRDEHSGEHGITAAVSYAFSDVFDIKRAWTFFVCTLFNIRRWVAHDDVARGADGKVEGEASAASATDSVAVAEEVAAVDKMGRLSEA